MRDGQSSYLPPDDETCHLKRPRHPPTTGKDTTGRASEEFSSSRCPTLPAPVCVPDVHGAAGAKFPCSQSVTDCLAGFESATRDDLAAGTVRLTVDGLRHCSFPALSTGESRPGWKGWFLWSDGVVLDWRLDGDKVGLAGIARLHPEYQGKSLRSFCHHPDTPDDSAETASGIHGGRHSPDSRGKLESSFRDASFRLPFCPSIIDRQFRPCCSARHPCSCDRQRGASRQSAVPMNITQIICQVLPGRNLAAKAASVLKRHVFTESGGNS